MKTLVPKPPKQPLSKRKLSSTKAEAESLVPPGATGNAVPAGIRASDPAAKLEELDGYQLLVELRQLFGSYGKMLTDDERMFVERHVIEHREVVGAAPRKWAIELIRRFTAVDSAAASRPKLSAISRETVTETTVLGQGVMVPIAKIDRHTINRHPKQVEVDARAASLQVDGQLEDCIVREVGARYQMISGETRLLAAKQLKWGALSCKIIKCTDAEAARRVAVHNGERSDLDPIQRAQLVEQLCKPASDGGAGLTREAAAKCVGLSTGAAASNLVRLLTLPKVWQDRVASGELPESFARVVCRVASAPKLLTELEKSWKEAHAPKAEEWKAQQWESRKDLEDHVEEVIAKNTRPMDGKLVHEYSYQEVGEWFKAPRLFNRTAKHDTELGVVTLEIDGAHVEVATDAKAFDKLNIPLVRVQLAERAKASAKKLSKETSKSQDKPRTAAEEKQLKKEQAEQLQRRIDRWRYDWLKSILTSMVEHDDRLPQVITFWLTKNPLSWGPLAAIAPSAAIFEHAESLRVAKPNGTEIEHLVLAFDGGDTASKQLQLARSLATRVLTFDDSQSPFGILRFDDVDHLASMCDIDLDDEWSELQRPHATEAEKARLESFFLLHQTSQLDALAEELSIDVTSVSGKQPKIAAILAYKQLPLPSSIAPIKTMKELAGKPAARKRGAK